jgi:hypothetical protein
VKPNLKQPADHVFGAMIRIAITAEAFEAVVATLPGG